jgi:UDP-N-acetylmuramoylalanine--D-glutamate ligase
LTRDPAYFDPAAAARADWSGKRVTLMGLGRHGGGAGAARFLAQAGSRITLSERAPLDELDDGLALVRDVPFEAVHAGGHDPRHFQSAYAVVVNPAVGADHPCLVEARRSGCQVTSEIELFLRYAPSQVIGVTGSVGKSTTSAMLSEILRADGRRTWLGGNFGGSLLDDLARMQSDDWIVLELSSFQLAHLSDQARLPRWAVITNCAPHHLEWHGGFEAYAAAKRRLAAVAGPDSFVILNERDREAWSWRERASARVLPPWSLERVGSLPLAGEHNRQNAACAAAAAEALGVKPQAIRAALGQFRGLPHRMESLGWLGGRVWINDSKATTPIATAAALDAFKAPTWLLVGGKDGNVSFAQLATHIRDNVMGIAAFGAARHKIAQAISSECGWLPLTSCKCLQDAVGWCYFHSQPADTILLSPGCPSHDAFADFQARGDAFRQLAFHFSAASHDLEKPRARAVCP